MAWVRASSQKIRIQVAGHRGMKESRKIERKKNKRAIK
jgi:hypothetical protein